MRSVLGWTVLFLVACGDDAASDAGPSDPSAAASWTDSGAHDGGQLDASAEDARVGNGEAGDAQAADPALRAVVVDLLTELDRQADVRCPCQTDAGDFESNDACLDVLSGAVTWQDCVTAAAVPHESPETRALIQCQVDRFRFTNDCLEMASCSDLDVAECFGSAMDCALPDLQILTQLSIECPDVIYQLVPSATP